MWWLSIPSNRNRLVRSVGLSVLLVGGIFSILITVIFFGMQLFEIILPDVWVGKQNLGLKTVSSAIPLLDEAYNQNHHIVLFAPGWQSARKPAQLGIRLDHEATARLAYESGYKQGFLNGLERMLGLGDPLLVVPVVLLDETTARVGLQEVAEEAVIVPNEARFTFESGIISVENGRLGQSLDVVSALDTLAAEPLNTFLSGYLPVEFTQVMPAIAEIPPEVLVEAQNFVTQNLVFKAYDPIVDEFFEWPVAPASLAAALRLQVRDNQVVLAADPYPLRAELARFNTSFSPDRSLDLTEIDKILESAFEENPPILAMRYEPVLYLVQPGDTLLVIAWRQGIPLWRILNANPGLDPETLIAGTNIIIPAKTDLIELPVIFGKRILVDLTDQRLWGFEGDNLVINEVISTGIDRSPTQPGIFQVRSHVENAYASVWDLYMPNFVGIYEAWPGFENGFHGLPILSNGQTLWGGVLGQPVSYGCIILNSNAASNLYRWAEEGVIVEIRE